MSGKEKRAELDKDIRKTFDDMQAGLDRPACFGKWRHEGSGNCGRCWFRPDCKVNTKDFGSIASKRGIEKDKETSLSEWEKELEETASKLEKRESELEKKEKKIAAREEAIIKAEEELTEASDQKETVGPEKTEDDIDMSDIETVENKE